MWSNHLCHSKHETHATVPVLHQCKITDLTLLFGSNDKSTPQVQEVLDDSPFFVREDGVSIMNGANEGMS